MNQVCSSSIVVSLDNSGLASSDYWNIASTIQLQYASKLYYSYTFKTYANCENTQLAWWGTHHRDRPYWKVAISEDGERQQYTVVQSTTILAWLYMCMWTMHVMVSFCISNSDFLSMWSHSFGLIKSYFYYMYHVVALKITEKKRIEHSFSLLNFSSY